MILVTGASGFIGRRLAVCLAATDLGAALRCLTGSDKENADGDAYSYYRAGANLLRSRGIEASVCDLVTGSGLFGLGSAPIIFHLAANTHTWEADHRCNDIGTENLMRAIEPLGPDNHFIFTSTTAVLDARDDLDRPMTATPEPAHTPLSEYGASKWRAEKFLTAEAAREGFRLSILRLCTVYGPDPRPNTLFEVMKREVARGGLAARLNWPALTSFVHVDDVVAALLEAAANPPEPGQSRVQLVASESRTLAEVSRLLHTVQGASYRQVSLPKSVWKVLGNARHLCKWGAHVLPASIYNDLWRLNIVVNPVFNCERTSGNRPSLLANRIGDV